MGTAEQREKNNYFALPLPTPIWEESISLPFRLINSRLCGPVKGWSLGLGAQGGGRGRADCRLPTAGEKQTQAPGAPTESYGGRPGAASGRHRGCVDGAGDAAPSATAGVSSPRPPQGSSVLVSPTRDR